MIITAAQPTPPRDDEELPEGIDRDRFTRPYVTPPGGGKPITYQRVSTFSKMLEDTYRLGKWKQRMVALGLVDNKELRLAVAAHRDEKHTLDELCEEALVYAKAKAAATRGTAVHKLTHKLDRGEDLGVIDDDEAQADLAAYVTATSGFEHLAIEEFVVIDDLKIAGSFDRVTRLPDGRVVIADIKTGSIDYGMGSIALQLALYSRGVAYDYRTGTRTPLDVDQNVGLVIHLPAEQAVCRLIEVDIAAGWEAVKLGVQVKQWRGRRDISRPYQPPAPVEKPLYSRDGVRGNETTPEPPPPPVDELANLVASAPSPEALEALWRANAHRWADRHTELAAARKALLAAGMVTA